MILYDMNKSWVPPAGYTFHYVQPEGAYLRVVFIRHQSEVGGTKEMVVSIYVNDLGREVMRTTDEGFLSSAAPELPTPPVSRWYRFVDAFYLTLLGIKEMFRWHKN